MLLIVLFLSPLLMTLVPLVLSAWLLRRWGLDWALVGFGALTFVMAQALHIPFNHFALERWLSAAGWSLPVTALALGLSAGLFEELARYVALRRLPDRVGGWRDGVIFGLGHGGVEAVLVALLALYGLLQALALREVALESVVPPDQLAAARLQLEAYWGMAWYEPLWAFLERLSAMAFHVLATLMVLQAVRRRQALWLLAAVSAHALFNAAALVALDSLGVAATEILLAGIGVLCIVAARWLRPRLWGAPAAGVTAEASEPRAQPLPDAVEAERLDDSRYA